MAHVSRNVLKNIKEEPETRTVKNLKEIQNKSYIDINWSFVVIYHIIHILLRSEANQEKSEA